jgi:hypothetical protein
MDFSNEPYVRVYTRSTTTWRRLEWQGQCVMMQLLRVVDRAGVLDIEDMTPAEAVSLHTGLPPDVAEYGMARLLDLGVCVHNGGALLFPRYLDAQESTKSDRQRQRESREKRRATAAESVVTDRDFRSQNVTESHTRSHAVTSRHEPSQPVTLTSALLCSASALPSLAVPCSALPLPAESGAAAVAEPVTERPDLIGFKFVASTLGRSTFEIPPVGAFARQYGWIGSRPESERAAVKLALEADPWCQANRHLVDAKHLEQRWQKYLGGAPKTVVSASPRERESIDRVQKLRDFYADAIRKARDAGDEWEVDQLIAKRDYEIPRLEARLAS